MKRSREKHRRYASVILALLLSVTLLPAGVFAEELPGNGTQGEDPLYIEVEQDAEETAAAAVTAEDSEEETAYMEGDAESYPDEDAEQSEGRTMQAKDEPGEDPHTCPPHVFPLTHFALVAPTSTQSGTKEHYQCSNCGRNFADAEGTTEMSDSDLVIPAAGPMGKKFKLDGCTLQFKSAVVKTPPKFMEQSNIDHIQIKAAKKSIKLSWKNAKNMNTVDGVIILRKTGKSKIYKEVKRLSFRTAGGVVLKNAYTDKTAKKKNTPYNYRVVTFNSRDGVVYISHCSDWAAGQTTASRLKTVYKAKINKKSVKLQYKGTSKLSLKYSKPKTTYNSKSFRWYSDNPKVASVNKKGKVTAKAPGTTTIRGRLSCGKDITCKVKVVGAFKPKAPTIKVDVASTSSISLIWNSTKNANGYDLYRSDDGTNWNAPVRVKGTSKTVTGLVKNHKYFFYVVARNDNGPYSAVSGKSNVVSQKAVIKRRPTTVTGFPTSKTLISSEAYSLTIKVSSPEARKANLQMKSGGKWITKKTITLPKGAGVSSVTFTFPDDWWYRTTYWRLVIPKNNTSEAYTSSTLTITGVRRYQNPSKYVQISDSISKHGYSYYVSPVLVNGASTKSDHVEALIKTARKYMGDRYVQSRSGAPGYGIDESGLVMQSCYGAGVDLWPISPSTRPYNCVPSIFDAKLGHIKFKDAAEGSNDYPGTNRGDLVFFKDSTGTMVHVAIYLGYGQLIHASPVSGKVETSTIRALTDANGSYMYKVAGVRRIFN